MSGTDWTSDSAPGASGPSAPLLPPSLYPNPANQQSWQQGGDQSAWGQPTGEEHQGAWQGQVPWPTSPSGAPTSRFCSGCGTPLVQTAAVCPRCGTAVGSPRSKAVAVILAVFLGFWTWLYTYEQDKKKFWWGLSLAIVGGFLSIFLVGFVVVFGVWVWAIVSTASKPDAAYRAYPNGA